MPNQQKENKNKLNEGYQPNQQNYGFQPTQASKEIPKPKDMKPSLQSKPEKKE